MTTPTKRQTSAAEPYFAAGSETSDELERLHLLGQMLDGDTTLRLAALGVSGGWRCLEVGAGAGSIARWLAERVGPTGHVVATDIDLRFLGDVRPTVEVRRHDVTSDPLEDGAYDLVHCRMLLMHLSRPEVTLRKLTRALRPGGWLLAEEADLRASRAADPRHPATSGSNAVSDRAWEFVASAGIMDPFFGRFLPILVDELGLTDTGHGATTRVVRGGSPTARLAQMTYERLRAPLLAAGVVTEEEFSAHLSALDDPTFAIVQPMTVAVWGRLP